jgi:hypothetical protein
MAEPPPSRSSNQAHVDWLLPILLTETDGSEPWHWMRARTLAHMGEQLWRGHLKQRNTPVPPEELTILHDLESLLNIFYRHDLLELRVWRKQKLVSLTRDWTLVQSELKRLLPLVDSVL